MYKLTRKHLDIDQFNKCMTMTSRLNFDETLSEAIHVVNSKPGRSFNFHSSYYYSYNYSYSSRYHYGYYINLYDLNPSETTGLYIYIPKHFFEIINYDVIRSLIEQQLLLKPKSKFYKSRENLFIKNNISASNKDIRIPLINKDEAFLTYVQEKNLYEYAYKYWHWQIPQLNSSVRSYLLFADLLTNYYIISSQKGQ